MTLFFPSFSLTFCDKICSRAFFTNERTLRKAKKYRMVNKNESYRGVDRNGSGVQKSTSDLDENKS